LILVQVALKISLITIFFIKKLLLKIKRY